MKRMINIIVTVIMTVSMIVGVNVNAEAEVAYIEVTTMAELVAALKKEEHFTVVTYTGYNELSVTYSWDIEAKAKFDEWITACPEEANELEKLANEREMTLYDVVEYYTNWHLKTSESYKVFDTLVMS